MVAAEVKRAREPGDLDREELKRAKCNKSLEVSTQSLVSELS